MNKIKILLALLITLFSMCDMHGQDNKDYNLKAYEVPDIARNTLDFSLMATGAYHKSKHEIDDLTSKAYSFSGGFKSMFNRYTDTRKFFGSHKALLGIHNYKARTPATTDMDYESKQKTFYANVYYSNISRFYFKDNFFFATGGSLQYEFNRMKIRSYTEKETTLQAEIPVGIGMGRMKNVTEVHQAIYILQELTKKNILKRELSSDETLALAQIMATAKNKRFLNAGKRMRTEVNQVDSFFIANNMFADNTTAYSTILRDFWKTSDLFERKAGIVYSAGINTSYNYQKKKMEEPGLSRNGSMDNDWFSFNPFLLLQYENPVSVHWQHTATLSPNFDYTEIKSGDNENTNKGFQIDALYRLGFYPTPRTNISLTATEKMRWGKHAFKYSIQPTTNSTSFSASTQLALDLCYYVTHNIRVTGSATLQHSYSKSKIPLLDTNPYVIKGITASYMIGLAYVLY
ncbi:hypothetical protein D0T50_06725 [Bacteroides sp. 214]|uniref:hypothetical protein n=1 Tax=Bacteroides sp. 214 TaxID=2302935 RepID=UPI0013D5B3B9|nr:hypothetical protein [Bacteroides sp. 214]NDW12583.1 hypothetical protein [Bacteroides sp. 214]